MTNYITVIGLGAGDLDQLTLSCYKKIQQAQWVYLRTEEHPVVQALKDEGLTFHSFDGIYESEDAFDRVYQTISEELIQAAKTHHDIVYAVPGHPMVAEQTIQILLAAQKKEDIEVAIYGGQSFLDPLFSSLNIDPIEGFQMVDATSFNPDDLNFSQHLVICQVYDGFVASEVKLGLLLHLPAEYEVAIVIAAGSSEEEVKYVPLYELDHNMTVNNLRSIYVPPVKDKKLLYHQFTTLRDIIRTLRSPEGCPWDRKQTHATLKKYLIEEAYEVLSAIDEEDDEHLIEELGDVLLQVMLHAQIGEDEGYFSVNDIIGQLSEKMIRRHPHVFSDQTAHDEKDVEKIWERVKTKENHLTEPESRLDRLPQGLPSLLRAFELQKLAAEVGFDWDSLEPVLAKIKEELSECEEALHEGNNQHLTGELGDLIFAVVNLSRKLKIDPVVALEMTNQKFKTRFGFIEIEAKKRNQSLEDMTLEEMDQIWELSKGKSEKLKD